jgi:lipoprotein-anchoring transpeptidase ErfK/SrfK
MVKIKLKIMKKIFKYKMIDKKIVLSLIIVLLVFALTGCLNSGNLSLGTKIAETGITSGSIEDQVSSNTGNPGDSGGTDTPGNETALSGSDQTTTQTTVTDGNENFSAAETTEDTSTSTTASQSESNKEPADTLPQLSLEVIEGPVIIEGNSLCYYRIKANVKGNPHPKINFSKDDSSGAWGENIAQINLAPDETYELSVAASNSSGKANASAVLNWKESSLKTGQTNIISDEANPANYLIEVNLNEQKVIVFYKNSILKEMICSSGAPVTPTPKGTFKTSDKIKYAWLAQYDVGAYYFVRFYGSYLFHSTPFDKQGNLIEKEQQNLGIPVSHGCVRIDLNEAKWLYETVPSGVTVKIF